MRGVQAIIEDWARKNYQFTHLTEHIFPKKVAYEHFLSTHPTTSITRNVFGRWFGNMVSLSEGEKHTTKYFKGIQLQENPETPLPEAETVDEITVEVCSPEVQEWFAEHFEWTENLDDCIRKKQIYEKFKEDRPSSHTPDFMVGLILRRMCKIEPTKTNWRGIVYKNRMCPCCGKPMD